jgi:signal transduction histidine kinase
MAQSAPAFEEIRRDEVDKLIARFLQVRMFFAPLGIALVFAFACYESAAWRRIGLIGISLSMTAVQACVVCRYRRRMTLRSVLGNRLFMFLAFAAFLAATALTGGVDSPAMPVFFFHAALLALVLPRGTATATIGVTLLGILVLTIVQATGVFAHALPDLFGGGPHAGSRALLLTRSAMMLDGISERLMRERDQALDDHEEQMRTLTTVAGEIAHELKNPLASIKGLASLVARSAFGKEAEQMAVLRREVDRMQAILEEFLNFSRPLVPLAVADVELDELCADVLRMHQSLAEEQDVQLALSVFPGARVRADRRKLKQILINLVQNALDASPRGARIEVLVEPAAAGAVRVAVVDDGPGVDPELLARVFDAGVTTKESGSGLGLTLSRALARQHGGELTLAPAADGGCVAELLLPEEGRA